MVNCLSVDDMRQTGSVEIPSLEVDSDLAQIDVCTD